MNWLSLISGILVAIAAGVHAVLGTREFRRLQPAADEMLARQSWVQSLAGWQWVSMDLFVASALLLLVGLTDLVEDESLVLAGCSIYFAIAGTVWLLTVWSAGRGIRNRFLVLGQWMFCWFVSALTLAGFLIGR